MLNKASQDLLDNLRVTLIDHDSALRWNMKQFVRGLIWKIVLENETYSIPNGKILMSHDLDIIVDKILETSHSRFGDDGYAVWDEKAVKEETERVMTVLKKAEVAVDW